MLDALVEHLSEHPNSYYRELVAFLKEKFGVEVSTRRLEIHLTAHGMVQKTTRPQAQKQELEECGIPEDETAVSVSTTS